MDDMNYIFKNYLLFVFVFFIGSTIGYVIEIIFRRLYHKKWVNPGFLVGPYLPIYGLGLSIITLIHVIFEKYNLNEIYQIILMGISMTLLELIGGLIFLKQGVRLWDYTDRKGNYKGVICPLFTLIWTGVGALYIIFLATPTINAISWFINNISFSYVLGIFTGVIVIDFCYSTKLYKKIQRTAKNNNIDIMYEKLKEHIKEVQQDAKEKYSFILPFKQISKINEYINNYKENNKR